jgi:hypothetical protein
VDVDATMSGADAVIAIITIIIITMMMIKAIVQ